MLKKITLAAIILSLSACSSIYMPVVPNTPMLSNQGEFSAAAHISLKGNFNVNGAYAVGDHFAVIGNAAYLNSEKYSKDLEHSLYEVGGGYFRNFGPDNNRILEVYAGVGSGKNIKTYRTYDNKEMLLATDVQHARYNKTFLQVNYSSKKIDTVRLFGTQLKLNYGMAWRLSYAETKDFTINNVPHANEDNIFIEPVFFTRMVLSDEFQLQYTTGSNIGLKSRKFLNAGYSIFTIGAVLNIGKKPRIK